MTGAEHYAEAEEILEVAHRSGIWDSHYLSYREPRRVEVLLARAQVHPTLAAAAAATALGTSHAEGRTWADVARKKPRAD